MEDALQVQTYAEADFSIPHNQFIQHLKAFVNNPQFCGTALDLGCCGPGDICRRFAEAFPSSKVHAVDGSEAMINYGKLSMPERLKQRIDFILGRLPDVILQQPAYDIIFSNSLLHHLPDPQVLWQSVKRYSRPGTHIVVMDLLRPGSIEVAQGMVQDYAGQEPEILQRDFYHSLLAAFSLEEINQQLIQAALPLRSEQISDRHVLITGIAP